MGITAKNYSQTSGYILAVRCPGCSHQGTFEGMGVNDLAVDEGFIAGLRRCPNGSCRALVYYIRNGTAIATFPSQQIDFDSTNIPPPILSVFKEAITCHAAQCYAASAMMIRKTLELLCKDRGAIGDNLKDRIVSLRSKILIPEELMTGMDDLRLLGNDAAHIDSQSFNNIGEEELQVAFVFTKEILKSVYQYADLLKRLRLLKKIPASV